MTYDREGRPVADASFTSTSDTKRHAVVVPPSKVIPVVLIPGIMGSNLMVKNLPEGFAEKHYRPDTVTGWAWPPALTATEGWGDRAWRPDDGTSFMARRFWPLEAHERRRLLDPANTVVDNRAEIPSGLLEAFVFDSAADGRGRAQQGEQRRLGFVHEMNRRGWGTVMLTSYGPLLAFLEKHLNQMYLQGDLNQFWSDNILQRQHVTVAGRGVRTTQASEWGVIKRDRTLKPDDIKKAARFWLPVHAAGYNWTQSNSESAKHVAGEVTRFIDHYKALGYECDKVLLVTHSMGGLVARAVVHPEMGNVADKVLGVIHGVMPTHGAAAAYRRCRAGFEGAGYSGKGPITAKILGKDGKEVAAVFSNSPGALQLLPSKLYGMNWLTVKDAAGKTLLSKPEKDPYKEIYEQRDVWWRLMNPAWLNPKPKATATDQEDAWDLFGKNLDMASTFHNKIGVSLHPHTHIQYGADTEKNRAFGAIAWSVMNGSSGLTGKAETSLSFVDGPDGTVSLRDVMARNGRTMAPAQFTLSDKDEAGDGTVPRRSAAALNDHAELVAEHAGYEHQGSYQDIRAQELVAYSVVRLIAENMP